uniref:EAL domain-containing protein n=1 Tax=Fervidobacterium nodosum TaxID=2424 RepID=A0A7C5Y625_9BACT
MKPLAFWFSLIESQEYFEILNEQRLTVHFQPVVESKSLRIIGYETLIRGVKKDGTLVSPKFLFDTAEKTDTLFYLDRFCRETAVKTSAVKKLLNYKIFINFIPTSIYDPVFCLQSTIQWAKHLEFEPSNLVFEVVESYKVSDIEHLSNVLNYYRNHGFLVALDDVGSGYSNLNVLVNLKPDIIKIDREIIRNIHNDELKQSVFKAIILLSKESNIQVLAEGVETVEEYNFVKEHVDLVQGYLFAKPNPEPIRQIQLQL